MILEWIEQNLGIHPLIQQKLFYTLLVIGVLSALRWFIQRSFVQNIKDTRVVYQWKKTLGYIFFVVGVLIVAPLWLGNLQNLLTYLGLLSAGLAVALKDPITDIIGWAFIVWRRPFAVGDRIQIGEYAGDVIDQRVFQFTLMEIGNWVHADQSTGRVLHVPNGVIFTAVLANYTRGSDYIWNEIPVLVTFESDWQKAKAILQEIINQHAQEVLEKAENSFQKASRKYMIHYSVLTPTVYTSVQESGVLLTIRYLCEPRRRRNSTQMLWESILMAFAQHDDIDFAYPTQRFYTLSAT